MKIPPKPAINTSSVVTGLCFMCSIASSSNIWQRFGTKLCPSQNMISFTHSLPVLNVKRRCVTRKVSVCTKHVYVVHEKTAAHTLLHGVRVFCQIFLLAHETETLSPLSSFWKVFLYFLWTLCFHCVTSYLFLCAQPKQTWQKRVFLPSTSKQNLCKTNISGKLSSDIFNQFEWFKLSVLVWTQETQLVCVCFCLQVGMKKWNLFSGKFYKQQVRCRSFAWKRG